MDDMKRFSVNYICDQVDYFFFLFIYLFFASITIQDRYNDIWVANHLKIK